MADWKQVITDKFDGNDSAAAEKMADIVQRKSKEIFDQIRKGETVPEVTPEVAPEVTPDPTAEIDNTDIQPD